ncbi:2-C-methyl-D-erythritol 4-phosphate cytidylyltransferase [Marivirga atlantica]|jgi:2-C-methyl-D-erythritol 4-phosphate cytidylyltransferase|uniref:2-C-methyl-D-erythritol 4-phosphate cytidylyltransferase n=1 Tax=Marivirga atlantica TaxID=1548457 RepID=A0A937ANK3_9BACT|nr:2-C-methyl-D-erythritol 4-phosphate cytidylyltransferase [Marivirga atlantica]MBL0766783.1 2-C-methyl-D-erythritol 4-phosphate cytidylyltransferase [Marivirga atlantica]
MEEKVNNQYAIIVAGGAGSRMQSEIPKQFLELKGLPILMHTLTAFYNADQSINIILTLPKDQIAYWKSLCTKFDFTIKHEIVEGGETRFHSVSNGLKTIKIDDGIVAIHDGVRPLISPNIIKESIKQSKLLGNAIVCVPMKDSVRERDEQGNRHLDRNKLVAVQTPQTFNIKLIKEAFKADYQPTFTDDASVFEANSGQVNLIEGDYMNIKITTPEDLIFAEAYMEKRR